MLRSAAGEMDVTRTPVLQPRLSPVQETFARLISEDDCRSSIADASSVIAGSVAGNSVVSSLVQSSVQTFGKYSAFTAPPRYRNSGAFVHGTKFSNFHAIMQDGLRAAKSEIFMIDEVRPDGRVPGLKTRPEILIFIDENKARSENMEFEYDATQGTWKTKGINGIIRPWFFQKVVDQRRGPGRTNLLFQSKEDPMMQANLVRDVQRPRYLMHATFWENVFGILSEGIVPAKNPTSSMRAPFRALLQGAESHVYTVSCSGDDGHVHDHVMRRLLEPFQLATKHSGGRDASPEANTPCPLKVSKDQVGLERPPDAYFIIDTQKAEDLGLKLDMVQSADREEIILVQGPVPRDVLMTVVPNEPINLPESLRAKIVDPRAFEDIPIIDLSKDEATVVKQMRYACEVVGFMQVVGHGVSEELQARHMAMQKRFFQMPENVKRRLALDEESPVRGYFGKGGEDLDQVLEDQVDSAGSEKIKNQSRKDNKEALDMNGVPWSKPQGGFVSTVFGMPSRFPEEEDLPGFKETMEEYSAAMFELTKKVLSAMALVLGRPSDFFEQFLTAPVATHRLLHYWPIEDFNTQIGVGEHTDFGLLTILKQDEVGGLQVLNAKDSRWVHCCPIENGYVVNLGDMMSRWTAHRFKSTVHRVVNVSSSERFSAPFFLEPNMETVIRYGSIGDGALGQGEEGLTEHSRRCRLRKLWAEARTHFAHSGSAEDILERFYRASGQLKVRGFNEKADQT